MMAYRMAAVGDSGSLACSTSQTRIVEACIGNKNVDGMKWWRSIVSFLL